MESKSVVVIDKIRMQIEGPLEPFHFSGLIMTWSLSLPRWIDLLVNGQVESSWTWFNNPCRRRRLACAPVSVGIYLFKIK